MINATQRLKEGDKFVGCTNENAKKVDFQCTENNSIFVDNPYFHISIIFKNQIPKFRLYSSYDLL